MAQPWHGVPRRGRPPSRAGRRHAPHVALGEHAPLTSTDTVRAKLKTRSMSCSISSTVTSAGSAATMSKISSLALGHAGHRLVEQQHARVAGSARRSRAGALAVGEQRTFWSYSARRQGGTFEQLSQRSRRARRAQACPRAGRRCRAGAGDGERERLISGVSSWNSWLIWKVRDEPAHALVRGQLRDVLAVEDHAPSRLSTPVSRLISVVLPAPFRADQRVARRPPAKMSLLVAAGRRSS